MTTVSRGARRAHLLDDPRFERYRNPPARRRLAAAMVAGLVGEGVLFAFLDELPNWLSIPAVALVLIAGVSCLGMLKASTRGVEELPEHALDERQAQLRGRVFVTAYRVGSGLFTAGLVVLALWLTLDLPYPGGDTVTGAFVVAFHLTLALPTLVAAFRSDT
jgi:hypothetical protein